MDGNACGGLAPLVLQCTLLITTAPAATHHAPCCPICAQTLDSFGQDPARCMLPAFLGGTIKAAELEAGTSIDIHLEELEAGPVVAQLVAFVRNGQLVVTAVAQCGWLLLGAPVVAPADGSPAALPGSAAQVTGRLPAIQSSGAPCFRHNLPCTTVQLARPLGRLLRDVQSVLGSGSGTCAHGASGSPP